MSSESDGRLCDCGRPGYKRINRYEWKCAECDKRQKIYEEHLQARFSRKDYSTIYRTTHVVSALLYYTEDPWDWQDRERGYPGWIDLGKLI